MVRPRCTAQVRDFAVTGPFVRIDDKTQLALQFARSRRMGERALGSTPLAAPPTRRTSFVPHPCVTHGGGDVTLHGATRGKLFDFGWLRWILTTRVAHGSRPSARGSVRSRTHRLICSLAICIGQISGTGLHLGPPVTQQSECFVTSENLPPQLQLRRVVSRPTLGHRLRRHLVEQLAAARTTADAALLAVNFCCSPEIVAVIAEDPDHAKAIAAEIARITARRATAAYRAAHRQATADFERLCAELRAERAAFAADPAAARAAPRPGLSPFQRTQLVQARRIRIEVAARNLCVRLERRDRSASTTPRCTAAAVARRPRARRSHRVVRVVQRATGDSGDSDEPPRRPILRARGPPPLRVSRAAPNARLPGNLTSGGLVAGA